LKEFYMEAKEFWPLILIFGQMAIICGQWYFGKRFATKKELNSVVEDLESQKKETKEIDTRVVEIEAELKHLPTANDIKELEKSISKLSADISGMQSTSVSLGNSVKLFNQYLISQSKDGK